MDIILYCQLKHTNCKTKNQNEGMTMQYRVSNPMVINGFEIISPMDGALAVELVYRARGEISKTGNTLFPGVCLIGGCGCGKTAALKGLNLNGLENKLLVLTGMDSGDFFRPVLQSDGSLQSVGFEAVIPSKRPVHLILDEMDRASVGTINAAQAVCIDRSAAHTVHIDSVISAAINAASDSGGTNGLTKSMSTRMSMVLCSARHPRYRQQFAQYIRKNGGTSWELAQSLSALQAGSDDDHNLTLPETDICNPRTITLAWSIVKTFEKSSAKEQANFVNVLFPVLQGLVGAKVAADIIETAECIRFGLPTLEQVLAGKVKTLPKMGPYGASLWSQALFCSIEDDSTGTIAGELIHKLKAMVPALSSELIRDSVETYVTLTPSTRSNPIVQSTLVLTKNK